MCHHMLNDDEEGDLHRMAITKMWDVSQQTGATGGMMSYPIALPKHPGG